MQQTNILQMFPTHPHPFTMATCVLRWCLAQLRWQDMGLRPSVPVSILSVEIVEHMVIPTSSN